MTDFAMVVPAPGGPEAFERREIEVPPPGPGEALIRHTAIGLNFLDTYHRSGLYPWPVDKDLVPGSEAAGVVEAVGAGVETVREGDRVAYVHPLNGYQTRRIMPADRLVKIPDAVSDEAAAAAMLKGMTVHYLIHSTFPVQEGQFVLGHAAAGGVGLIMGQWLKAKGAVSIGTAGGPEKTALAREAGWTHVVDSRAEDFVERVKEITGGAGAHVVYDSVGKDTWRGSMASLRPRGMFVTFGQSSGVIEGFSLGDLAAGGSLTACRPSLFHYIPTRSDLERRAGELFAAMADGTVRIAVNQSFGLADAAEAHRALEGRRTTGGTVLIP